MKHKHAAPIHAWADGAEIEIRRNTDAPWEKTESPKWYSEFEYRIKPEPKPDVVVCSRIVGKFAFTRNGLEIQQLILHPYLENANIKYTFDGETGKLKSAEVL